MAYKPSKILLQYPTPILISLHWLPANFRIDFKILMLTYRALHGQDPQYITYLLHPHTMNRAFRSSTQGFFKVYLGHILRLGEIVLSTRQPCSFIIVSQ